MKRLANLTSGALLLCLVFSCSIQDADTVTALGKSVYTDSFWWTDADTTFIEKTIRYQFNDGAKEAGSHATLCFTDEKEQPLDMQLFEIYLDGKRLKSPCLDVESSCTESRLEMRCLPQTEAGTKNGYLIITSHDLDRVNDTEIGNGDETKVCKWQFAFVKRMNPLKKDMFILSGIILCGILVWFVFLKRMFYPTFRRTVVKNLIIPNCQITTLRMGGCRKVIVGQQVKKQSVWNRVWTGKVLCKNDRNFTSPVTLMPKANGKKIIVRYNSSAYQVSPPLADIYTKITIQQRNGSKLTILLQ